MNSSGQSGLRWLHDAIGFHACFAECRAIGGRGDPAGKRRIFPQHVRAATRLGHALHLWQCADFRLSSGVAATCAGRCRLHLQRVEHSAVAAPLGLGDMDHRGDHAGGIQPQPCADPGRCPFLASDRGAAACPDLRRYHGDGWAVLVAGDRQAGHQRRTQRCPRRDRLCGLSFADSGEEQGSPSAHTD